MINGVQGRTVSQELVTTANNSTVVNRKVVDIYNRWGGGKVLYNCAPVSQDANPTKFSFVNAQSITHGINEQPS